jgi:flagellum-specific ATP synthase
MLMGGYQAGQDPELDQAFQIHPQLIAYIQQGMNERATFLESDQRLQMIIP